MKTSGLHICKHKRISVEAARLLAATSLAAGGGAFTPPLPADPTSERAEMQDKPTFLTIRATPALLAAIDRAVLEREGASLWGVPSRSAIVREAIIEYLKIGHATVAPAQRRGQNHA